MPQNWYYSFNGGPPQGPVSGQQLIQLAKRRFFRPADLVWMEKEKPWRVDEMKVLAPFLSGHTQTEKCQKDVPAATTLPRAPRGWDDFFLTKLEKLEPGRSVKIKKSYLTPGDLDLLQAIYDLKDNGPSYSISLRAESDASEMDVQRGKPAIRSSPSRSSPRLTVECPHCGNLFEVDPNVDASCDECRLERAVSGTWHWPDGTPFLSRRRRRGHQS